MRILFLDEESNSCIYETDAVYCEKENLIIENGGKIIYANKNMTEDSIEEAMQNLLVSGYIDIREYGACEYAD